MPVPQRVNFLVEQASCLVIKSLLRMVQHLSLNLVGKIVDCLEYKAIDIHPDLKVRGFPNLTI